MSKPIVAIVGRQNVGKSTLLNRIVGKPLAIVADMPGTTRDRLFADVVWGEKQLTVIDTGGIEIEPTTNIGRLVKAQAYTAMEEADVIIFLVDAQQGVLPMDLEIADSLRRTKKPVIVAANKADNRKLEMQAVEFHELGLGEPVPVSAYHGQGVAELLEKVVSLLPSAPAEETDKEAIKVAIVGRPNVGKSLLLNSLLGKERVIVDEIAGTTRDAIDTVFEYNGQNILLIDTAGIRKKGRIEQGIEDYSVIRSLRAIDRADVVLLVIDATEALAAQDAHIAGYIEQAAKGIILVVNKWDIAPERDTALYTEELREQFKFMPYASMLFISAKTKQGVEKIIPLAAKIYRVRFKRLSTAEVNNIVQQALAGHTPPHIGRRQLKVLYTTQADVNPPTFIFFVNDAKLVHFSYRRYLENKIREALDLTGTPLRMIFKSRSEK